MFKALVMTQDSESGKASAEIQDLNLADLPDGEVTVAVDYSTVNYKDGLCLSAKGGGLVRNYPHVPGIDFAGTVEASSDGRYKPGDKVVLTGWRVGRHIGVAIPKRRGSRRIGWCHCRMGSPGVRPWQWERLVLPQCWR